MSGISDQNAPIQPTTKPQARPGTLSKGDSTGPAAGSETTQSPEGDRLATVAAAPTPTDPRELVQRIKALQEGRDFAPSTATPAAQADATATPRVQVPTRTPERTTKAPTTPPRRRGMDPTATPAQPGLPTGKGDYLAPFMNLLIPVLSEPRLVLKRIQGMLSKSYRVAQGSQRIKELANAFGDAVENGRGINFVQGKFRVLTFKYAEKARETIQLVKEHEGKRLMQMFAQDKPTPEMLAKNKGMVNFYQAARAEGANPVEAVGKSFARSVDAGGNMPLVAEEAAEIGGRWGRVVLWAGRIARVAPLLNIPLAAFDLRGAWRSFTDPKADLQDKISKGGRAVLTSSAAGLAIAGFLTPPPINATLLTAAGIAGIASTVWSIGTSEIAMATYHKIGHFFGRIGHFLGL